MKKLFALLLIAGLSLAGCAAKKNIEDQATTDDVAPVVANQEKPPVIIEEATTTETEIAAVEVQKAAIEPASDRIFFDFDSTLLTPDSKEVLVNNALWLQDQSDVRIVIEGHTDERGSSSYNLGLGEKRAKAARAYLLNFGIDPKRITTISYGEEKASKGVEGDTVWAQDRRAEFVKRN